MPTGLGNPPYNPKISEKFLSRKADLTKVLNKKLELAPNLWKLTSYRVENKISTCSEPIEIKPVLFLSHQNRFT